MLNTQGVPLRGAESTTASTAKVMSLQLTFSLGSSCQTTQPSLERTHQVVFLFFGLRPRSLPRHDRSLIPERNRSAAVIFFRPTPSWLPPGRYTRSIAAKR